jgi:hypothetical protein
VASAKSQSQSLLLHVFCRASILIRNNIHEGNVMTNSPLISANVMPASRHEVVAKGSDWLEDRNVGPLIGAHALAKSNDFMLLF